MKHSYDLSSDGLNHQRARTWSLLSLLELAVPFLVADARQVWTVALTLLKDRRHVVVVAGLTALAALIRLAFLNQPMRFDEAKTFLVFASKPLRCVISDYGAPNNHIFHTVLVHVATHVVGSQPWAIRLPALTCGILSVPACYVAARALYDKHSALLSAGLVASSSALAEYSTNARGYTLLCLLALLSVALAAYVRRHRSYVAWALLVICTALGFYTIPIMLYPFGAIVAWLILSWLVRDIGEDYCTRSFMLHLAVFIVSVAVLTALLYAPVCVASGLRSLIANPFVRPLEWSLLRRELCWSVNSTWEHWTRDLPVPASLALAAGCLASFVWHKKVAKHVISLPLVALVWSVVAALAQRVAPWPRVWLFLLPLFLMAASAGLTVVAHPGRLWTSWRFDDILLATVPVVSLLLSLNVLVSGSILSSTQTGTLQSAEQITYLLKDRLQPGDIVLAATPSNYPLRYYFQLHDLPQEVILERNADAGFQRAIIVVNRAHGQEIEEVVRSFRLPDGLDLEAARILADFASASVYEAPAIQGTLSGR